MRYETRVVRIGQVEKRKVEGKLRIGPGLTGMDHVAAPEVHDDQQLLVGPDPQLARRDADIARVRLADLADDFRARGILDIEDQDSWVRMRAGIPGGAAGGADARRRAIRAIADVREMVVDGQRGVHPAVEERI